MIIHSSEMGDDTMAAAVVLLKFIARATSPNTRRPTPRPSACSAPGSTTGPLDTRPRPDSRTSGAGARPVRHRAAPGGLETRLSCRVLITHVDVVQVGARRLGRLSASELTFARGAVPARAAPPVSVPEAIAAWDDNRSGRVSCAAAADAGPRAAVEGVRRSTV